MSSLGGAKSSCQVVYTVCSCMSASVLKINTLLSSRVANHVDLDLTPHDAASYLGLHCLLMPIYSNT